MGCIQRESLCREGLKVIHVFSPILIKVFLLIDYFFDVLNLNN